MSERVAYNHQMAGDRFKEVVDYEEKQDQLLADLSFLNKNAVFAFKNPETGKVFVDKEGALAEIQRLKNKLDAIFRERENM